MCSFTDTALNGKCYLLIRLKETETADYTFIHFGAVKTGPLVKDRKDLVDLLSQMGCKKVRFIEEFHSALWQQIIRTSIRTKKKHSALNNAGHNRQVRSFEQQSTQNCLES